MKHGNTARVCLVGCLALCVGATIAVAVTADYQPIIERNVFGLKPPPPPPPDPSSIKPPPPRLILTGITTIFGNKRALLKGNFPAKAGDPAKEQSYILGEGQRDGDIEVIKIDEKALIVTVDDFGTVTNITFEKEGSKPSVGGGSAPGLGSPAGAVPPPIANPRSIPIPLRQMRMSNVPDGAASTWQPTATAGTGSSTGPTFGGAVPAEGPPEQRFVVPGGMQQVTPEEQVILMEADRAQHQSDPSFPPYPPTALSQAMEAEAAAANGQNAAPRTPGQKMPTLPIPGRPPGFGPPGF